MPGFPETEAPLSPFLSPPEFFFFPEFFLLQLAPMPPSRNCFQLAAVMQRLPEVAVQT